MPRKLRLGSPTPDDLRAAGWTVGVHTDYCLGGEAHTFWLMTRGDECCKGDGRTDAEALDQIRHQLAPQPRPPSGRARGGHARAAALPAERRAEIARAGAAARWSGARQQNGDSNAA